MVPADLAEGQLDELAHRVGLAGRQHVVVGLVLLQDQPHALDIVAGMAPVALGVEIAEIEHVLAAALDRGDRAGDLAGDEGLAADRPFVVEQDAVGGVHAVGLAVVHRDPVGIELGGGIGAARIERRRLALRRLLHLAVQLGGRGLVEAHVVLHAAGCGSPRAGAACRARRRWRCIPASRSSPARGSAPRDCRSRSAAISCTRRIRLVASVMSP